jgi:chromosomal replication initiator protein
VILVHTIIAATAKHYGIPAAMISGPSQTREFTRPRQVVMCLARRLTDKSTVIIGKVLHRDHSTVIHGADKIESRRAEPDINNALRSVTRQLLSEAGR